MNYCGCGCSKVEKGGASLMSHQIVIVVVLVQNHKGRNIVGASLDCCSGYVGSK